jgi:hypothetical protein
MNKPDSRLKLRVLGSIFLILASFLSGIWFVSCRSKGFQDGNRTLSFEEVDFRQFSDIGRIEKIVKLDASEAPLSAVSRVKTDSDGDIYIIDLDRHEAVFRFNAEGKFLNSFGRTGQGPGEYQGLIGFDIHPSGAVFLLSNSKILKFAKNGEYLMETPIGFLGGDIKSLGDEIFVHVLIHRQTAPDNRRQVEIFDLNLRPAEGCFPYDSRLEKYIFISPPFLAAVGGELVGLEIYDLGLNIFHPGTRNIRAIRFGERNSMVDGVFRKNELSEEDRTQIKRDLHRFGTVLAFRDTLYLFEGCKGDDLYKFWLFDFKAGRIRAYPYFQLFRDVENKNEDKFFSYPVGAYADGLIIAVTNPDSFAKAKSRYPELSGIEFGLNDNPLLVFFRFNGF